MSTLTQQERDIEFSQLITTAGASDFQAGGGHEFEDSTRPPSPLWTTEFSSVEANTGFKGVSLEPESSPAEVLQPQTFFKRIVFGFLGWV